MTLIWSVQFFYILVQIASQSTARRSLPDHSTAVQAPCVRRSASRTRCLTTNRLWIQTVHESPGGAFGLLGAILSSDCGGLCKVLNGALGRRCPRQHPCRVDRFTGSRKQEAPHSWMDKAQPGACVVEGTCAKREATRTALSREMPSDACETRTDLKLREDGKRIESLALS